MSRKKIYFVCYLKVLKKLDPARIRQNAEGSSNIFKLQKIC
jgi:hypothetical protein